MSPFSPILIPAQLMAGFACPWFICGGWAIDLFLGRVTRKHGDREIGILRHHQSALRNHVGDKALFKAVTGPDGGRFVPWEPGEQLQLPIHQILIRPKGSPAPRGDWQAMSEEFEIFLNEGDDQTWRFRRNPAIARKLPEVIMQSSLGLPILAPEIQLLYKVKNKRPKDDLDFAATLPHLDSTQRNWLQGALEQAHPGDQWIDAL